MSTRCVWSAYRLPHTEHDDCPGLLPHLARDLQALMDHHAERTEETDA